MIRAFFAHWRRSATDLCVLLVFVQLPLALLFSFQARLFYQTVWELTKDASLLVVIYCVVASLIALAVALVASAIQLFSARRAEQFMALSVYAYCLLAIMSMQPFAQKWWWQMLALLHRVRGAPVRFDAVPWLFGVALVLFIWYVWRTGFQQASVRISASLSNGARPTLALLVVCFIIAAASGHMHWRDFGWTESKQVAAAPPDAPNVILVTIDTLAATDMSLYGYAQPTTPGLEKFAQGAYVFEHFLANSNYTTPTVTSMLTGRYPTSHTVYHHYAGIRPEQRAFNLATILRDHGYTTAAVVSNPMAHPMNIGIGDGFDYVSGVANAAPGHFSFRVFGFTRADLAAFLWDWWLGPAVREIVPRIPLKAVQKQPWFPPELVIDEARSVLAADRKPLFLWTHIFAPHEPYISPSEYMGKFLPTGDYDTLYEQLVDHPIAGLYESVQQPFVDQLRARYDEDIVYVDHEVSAFLEELDRTGVAKNAIVIIAADHGESFEKNWRGHSGPMLHQPLLHVPLIVRLPNQGPAGQRLTTNAEQVDLLPTVLDLLKIPKPAWVDGESLMPMMRDGVQSTKTKYAASVYRSPRFQPLTDGTVAVIQGQYKLVRYLASGCEELYDLGKDADERANLVAKEPEVAARLRETIPNLTGVPVPPADAKANCARPWVDQS